MNDKQWNNISNDLIEGTCIWIFKNEGDYDKKMSSKNKVYTCVNVHLYCFMSLFYVFLYLLTVFLLFNVMIISIRNQKEYDSECKESVERGK
jgi:hypothetical protein